MQLVLLIYCMEVVHLKIRFNYNRKAGLAAKYICQSAQHQLIHEGTAVNVIIVKVHNCEIFIIKIFSKICVTLPSVEIF